jgi:hypothetical protein
MSTMNPNQSLLQGAHQTESDKTPAALSGPSSAVSFAFKQIIPPSELYVNVDDQLIISGATSQTAEIVTVNVRLLLPNGRVEDMQFQIRPVNTRAVLKQAFGLAEGFLLSISASAAVAVTRGQTFLRVALQRSASGTGNPAYVLLADYVTTQAIPGYPNGRILSPVEGPGNILTVTLGNPGAGADWSFALPTNTRWRLQSFRATLTTSAAVANRLVRVHVDGTTGGLWNGPAMVAQTASQVITYSGGALTPIVGIDPTIIMLPLPPNLIINGASVAVQSFGSNTTAIQGADQWSVIAALVEEWLDNC